MGAPLTESTVEDAALEIFEGLGYGVLHGPDIAPGELLAERGGYGDVVLTDRLREALNRINRRDGFETRPYQREAGPPVDAIEEAVRKLLRTESPNVVENNRRFHRFLTDGIPVEYRTKDRVVNGQVQLFDFDDPDNNDWLAVNQFTVIEDRNNRRPDVVIFVNGLPLGVIELKNLADENATIHDAFKQLQTYKKEIPSLFPYDEALVISDGIQARIGALTSGWERFAPWRTISGDKVAPKDSLEMEVLLRGVFAFPLAA